MDELISIIIPVYKVEEYLDRCVESVLAQTYPNLEILLVDDGSPDRCGEMCDAWAKKDPRIRVIHKENGGLSDARNAGLDVATGEYIGFVDSDDWIDPDMYEKMLAAIKQYDANLAICCFYKHWQLAGTSTRQDIGCDQIYSKQKFLYELILDETVPNYAWNKLYHRSLFEGIRYPKGRVFEDILTIYKVSDRVTRAVHLSAPLYHYLRRGDSIVGSYTADIHIEACIARQELYKDVIAQHPELTGVLSRRYLESFWSLRRRFLERNTPKLSLCCKRIRGEIAPFFKRYRKNLVTTGKLTALTRLKTELYLALPGLYRKAYLLLKR